MTEFISLLPQVIFPSCCSSPSQNYSSSYSLMLLYLSSPIEPVQLTSIVDTRGFGGLGLFSSFLFNYFPDRLANIIASQVNQTKGSDRKMWLEVWEEKAIIPLCSAGSYQIRFISSCRTSELQGCRHRLVRQLLQEQRESSAHASGEGRQLSNPPCC